MKNADRGVAGLTVLLSVVTMLFVIGLLVMIFSLMGGEMRDATFTTTSVSVTNETLTGNLDTTGTTAIAGASLNDFASFTVTALYNATSGAVIPTANYTVNSDGTLTNATVVTYASPLNASYSYTYGAENTATGVMNDTTAGISSVTDWFNIFVVITAMVVLILLTVIIITAIRGSGLMSGASA